MDQFRSTDAGISKTTPFVRSEDGDIELQPLPTDGGWLKSLVGSFRNARPRRIPMIRVSRLWRWILRRSPRSLLLLLGWYQLGILSLSIIDALCPDSAVSIIPSILANGFLRGDILSTRDATSPVSCHSHNDYWRVRPLHSALEVGCSSVEADIWLEDGDLLVGHRQLALSKERTLQTLYLDPILQILHSHNKDTTEKMKRGVFEADPRISLTLLIDFKTDPEAIWPVVERHLEPLRRSGYLTYFNGSSIVEGPLTVVATGNVLFEDVIRNPEYREIFFDAPLTVMGHTAQGLNHVQFEAKNVAVGGTIDQALPRKHPQNAATYSRANSYYASGSFMNLIGYPQGSHLSKEQVNLIRAQIRGAHSRGLKVRYWDVPVWPVGIRNYLWRVLVREGADFLSVDDIRAAVLGDWGPRKGGWRQKWWT